MNEADRDQELKRLLFAADAPRAVAKDKQEDHEEDGTTSNQERGMES
jgi:hypothetical protein